MDKVADLQLEKVPFQDYFESPFAHISYLEENKIILCTLKAEYVPIEQFKDTFSKISELVEAGFNHKFIFDKRSLKAFHQPSMEWYFVIWKKDVFDKGLQIHRKILPEAPWFKKTVEIARQQIYQEYDDLIANQLDIKYCNSIEEAIAH